MNYALGWLRQVENQYLVAPPEVARTFPPTLQDLLGYALHGRIVGEWALEDPRVALLGRPRDDVVEADRRAGASADLGTLSGYRERASG
jgi:ectoine hydroxylase-related dioxygenase (phytanoyl-CoA dioxygenase family)